VELVKLQFLHIPHTYMRNKHTNFSMHVFTYMVSFKFSAFSLHLETARKFFRARKVSGIVQSNSVCNIL
jgi:hypothetical protein